LSYLLTYLQRSDVEKVLQRLRGSPVKVRSSGGGSKGARSFRDQNILESGLLDALFLPQKSWRPFFSCRSQNTKATNATEIVSLST